MTNDQTLWFHVLICNLTSNLYSIIGLPSEIFIGEIASGLIFFGMETFSHFKSGLGSSNRLKKGLISSLDFGD